MKPSIWNLTQIIKALFLFFLLLQPINAADPVTFIFEVPGGAPDPFSREISGEVITPSQKLIRLPAFFIGEGRFAVRARAEEAGQYELKRAFESVDGKTIPAGMRVIGSSTERVSRACSLPSVHCTEGLGAGFRLSDGKAFIPIGANLAWAAGSDPRWFRGALGAFASEGLNWTRIWMAHWDHLNLDWSREAPKLCPAPGSLDLGVAKEWDVIISSAEENRIYLQLVFQHHGQYSTGDNNNWKFNPWNAANPGGFLQSPQEFFTSSRAKELTQRKYRYIVARWGYSPAVMAWELFNEVHWVDSINQLKEAPAVAQWHSEMAAYLRSIDPYRHLITTSIDNVSSPINREMDFYQPHIYPSNTLAVVRRVDPAPESLDRPVFYGEVGDDHLPLPQTVKDSQIAAVPPVWASLMGQSLVPAQPWVGAELMAAGRLGELGSVARFITTTRWAERCGLTPFTAAMECATRVPLALSGGYVWLRKPAADIRLPVDGREPVEFADIPEILVGSPSSAADGFPCQTTFRFDLPRPSTFTMTIAGVGSASAAIRVTLDDRVVIEKDLPAHVDGRKDSPSYPEQLSFPVASGSHVLVVQNPKGPDWLELSRIDLGMDIPVLAAVGKRSADFIVLWIWHRSNVFSPQSSPAVQGTVLLEDVPAGSWRATWWDTLTGRPLPSSTLEHRGGLLRLSTPPITRHAAVVLSRD